MPVIVTVVGGLTPQLLHRWEGELPFFDDLRKRGRLRPLLSSKVPYEAPALASAFTGRGQGEHGVFSMWKMRSTHIAKPPQVIDARELGVPLLWELPQFGSRRVLAFNIIASHPPRPIHGVEVTYPWYSTTNAAYPRSLLAQLSRSGTPVAHDVSVFMRKDTDREAFKHAVSRVEDARFAAFQSLLHSEHFDLAIINLTLLDRLSHFYWNELSSDRDQADLALFQAYRNVDAKLGQLAGQLAPQDQMLVFGDVGFGDLAGFVSIDDLLVKAGLLVKGPDGCPDPHGTLAFESPQGSHGIVLADASRFVDGTVSDRDRESILEQVRQVLLDARAPQGPGPMFKRVERGEEAYPGQRSFLAPDLVVEPADPKYPPRGHRYWADHVSRDCQSAWHRRDTCWGWIGKDPVDRLGVSQVEDIFSVISDTLEMEPLMAGGSQ